MSESKARSISEAERLRAALSNALEHLHASRPDEARKACVDALAGEPQTVVALSPAAALDLFMTRFNALVKAAQLRACTVVFFDTKEPGKYAVQIGGRGDACKLLQGMARQKAEVEAEKPRLVLP